MRYIKKNTLIYIVTVFLCLVLMNLVNVQSDYSSYKWLSVLLSVEIVTFVWANTKCNGTVLNFSFIFIVLLALFNFGQVFLIGFFPESLIEKTVVLKYFSAKEGYSALTWINIAFVFLSSAILLSTKTEKNTSVYNTKDVLDERVYIKRAFILILLTFPIKVFIDMNFLIRAITIGFEYGKSWLNSFPNFIRTIGDFSVIGFAFLIVALKNKPSRQIKWFVFIILYFFILMLSGRRSENVSYLCVITYLLLTTRQKRELHISIKKLLQIIILLIFAYIVLLYLYTIVHVRDTIGNNIIYIIDKMFYYNKNENIILEEMREYGQTGYTAIAVLTNWLTGHSPSYGKSYIYGISAIFPNIGGIMGKLTEESTFGLIICRTPGILNSLYTNIGGNVLGEFFFNFGKIGGVIASTLLGIIIGKINSKVNKNIDEFNYNIIYMIPVMFAVLYWIRDYFGSCIRNIIWGLMICWIVKKIDKKELKGVIGSK